VCGGQPGAPAEPELELQLELELEPEPTPAPLSKVVDDLDPYPILKYQYSMHNT
jgi:hypothetical protein